MKKVVYITVILLLLTGCKPGDFHEFDTVFCFNEFGRIIDVTSNGSESKSYDIVIRRNPSEFLKNPPDNVRFIVIDEETTAIEGIDFHLSTKNVIFIKGEWTASFKLTISPVISTKTLVLMLDYKHPQLSQAKLSNGEDYVPPGHWARFRILPSEGE